jgi:hypothetical protein
MASFDYTFTSGDTVTPTKLNSARNVKDIVNADIKSDAAIALSKLATGALPAAITVASDNLVDGTIVNADINASAAIAGTKVAPNFGSQNVTTTGFVAGGTSSALAPIHGNRQSASAGWAVLAKSDGISNESGLYVDASNNMEVGVRPSSGVLAAVMRSSGASFINGGNLGVGTTIPASKLTVEDNSSTDAVRITQTGSGNALVVEDSANPDATPFVVTADGSVGIGAAPSAGIKLDVVGVIRSAFASVISGAASTYRYLAFQTNGVGRWDIGATDDAESGSNAGSNLFLHRFSDAGAFLERVLHISRSSGNVGINNNDPTERLEVNGTVKATAFSGPLTGNVTGTASAIADGSVSTAKIVDANVTNAKLASDIDASKITTGTLPIARIADDSVTNDKLSLAANAGEIKKALNADNDPPIYACRAWVNFDGTKNTAGEASTANTNRLIRASGNVSSVTRVAQGQYTVNFTTAMPDANYSTHATTASNSNSAFSANTVDGRTFTTTSAVRIVTAFANASNNGYSDPDDVSVAIFR